MLARFKENGYFLEVLVENVKGDDFYFFTVYTEDGDDVDHGWTEYRDIEMYYPNNWIDYIVGFCEPEDIEGEYELLEFKDMDEYLDKFGEDPKGNWILERQGDDDDIRRYSTFEAAQRVMNKEYESIVEDYYMENELEDDYAIIGGEEYYQSWKIYEDQVFDNPIKQKLYEIQKELDRADTGVSQYAFELMDTSVIRQHLYEVENLMNELKEMI